MSLNNSFKVPSMKQRGAYRVDVLGDFIDFNFYIAAMCLFSSIGF